MTPGIILSAGSSSRFAPQHKLLQLYQHHTILYHGLKAAIDSRLNPVFLVLGHRHLEMIASLEDLQHHSKLKLVINKDWASGRASTLRLGIKQLPKCENVLVYPGDMPRMDSELINDLIGSFISGEACFPVYNQRKGHPVIFPKEWFSDLMALQGEQSALELIKTHWETAVKLERIDVETQLNINTPEDYAELIKPEES